MISFLALVWSMAGVNVHSFNSWPQRRGEVNGDLEKPPSPARGFPQHADFGTLLFLAPTTFARVCIDSDMRTAAWLKIRDENPEYGVEDI